MLTNFETNKVFIAKGLSSVPYSSTEYSLVTTLYNQNVAWGELPYSESPFHIWARDYMPVQVNKDKFVRFNYNPDYLRNYPEYKPYTSMMLSCLGIKVINSDLVVDGGNIISCGDKVIMTDKIFLENAHINHTTLIDTLSHLLEAEIVLIPWDKYEEYGHADGMVRYMGNGNVLINNYCDFDKSLQKKLLGVLGRHFCVNELHYGTFTKRSWAYLNFLHVGRHLFIPMLGERLDSIAYGQIAESFPECECHPVINCESVVNEKVHSEVASMTDTTAIQELMSRVSAENKLFENNIPTLKQTVNDMANENKTQGFEFGAIAASLGMKDSDVKDVMARISELATIESKYKEAQKSLSDAQTVIAGKEATIQNLQKELSTATSKLSAFEKKEKEEMATRIETLVEDAINAGKIDREAKSEWVKMAESNLSLAESTLASIPAREKISEEIAKDPANVQAAAAAVKSAEEMMAEKVTEVVGENFKFGKL